MGGGHAKTPPRGPSACLSQEGSPAGEQPRRRLRPSAGEIPRQSALTAAVAEPPWHGSAPAGSHGDPQKEQKSTDLSGRQMIGCDSASGCGGGDNPAFMLLPEFPGSVLGLTPPTGKESAAVPPPKGWEQAEALASVYVLPQRAVSGSAVTWEGFAGSAAGEPGLGHHGVLHTEETRTLPSPLSCLETHGQNLKLFILVIEGNV